jgi:hypothetical protein
MFNVTRERFIGIRLTTKGLENLNAARGGWSRSEYVRQAAGVRRQGWPPRTQAAIPGAGVLSVPDPLMRSSTYAGAGDGGPSARTLVSHVHTMPYQER